MRRENVDVRLLRSLRGALATKQSRVARVALDCFAPLAMTGYAVCLLVATPRRAGAGEDQPLAAFFRHARCTAQLQPGGCEEISLAGVAAGAVVGIASCTARLTAERSCEGM